MNYYEANQTAPDIVIRGHCHKWGDSYDAHRTRLITSSAWTFSTEYGHRIAPGDFADVGGFFIYIDHGKYEVEKFKVPPKERIWTVL